MNYKLLILIIFLMTIRKHNLNNAKNVKKIEKAEFYNISTNAKENKNNLTNKGNIDELHNNPKHVLKENVKDISKIQKITKPIEDGNISKFYNFPNKRLKAANKNVKNLKTSEIGDIAELYSNFPPSKTTPVMKILYKIKNKHLNYADIKDKANTYNKPLIPLTTNHTVHNNKNTSLMLYTTARNHKQQNSTIASLADLYFFTSTTKMGIFNCTYDNTINIERYRPLPNGSYVYDNETLIPPELVGDYDYEIFYNGSKHCVPQHKRACICKLKPCISLCSDNIIQFYQDFMSDFPDEMEVRQLFYKNTKLANGSIVAKNIIEDFEHIILNKFCETEYKMSPEKDSKLSWILFENGSLFRNFDSVEIKKNEYCFDAYEDKFGNQTFYLVNPKHCALKMAGMNKLEKLNYCIQVISIPFFLFIITAYCCLPDELTVNDKCFLSYLSSVSLSYALTSFINLSQKEFEPIPCKIMGYFNYYMQLSYYIWLAILSYDTWKLIPSIYYERSYLRCCLWGYTLPLIMTLSAYWAQNSKHIDESLKPGISESKCGLEVTKWSAILYLYGPCLVILIFCLYLFILTWKRIESNDKDAKQNKKMPCEHKKLRYFLYLRLFVLMGLTWFLDMLSYFLIMFEMRSASAVLDYINSLQGLYMFASIMRQKRILNLIRTYYERYSKRKTNTIILNH